MNVAHTDPADHRVRCAGTCRSLVRGDGRARPFADERRESRDAGIRAAASSGDVAGARTAAEALAHHAHLAHFYTSGPVWAALSAVPFLGAPVDTTRGLTAAADKLGRTVVPELIDVSNRLDPKTLRQPGDRFDVAAIAAITPTVQAMTQQTGDVQRGVGRLPAHTWLGVVDSARSSLLTSLGSLDSTLTGLDNAVRVAPAMLGETG